MKEMSITKPDDFHSHLRQGELMPHLVREVAKVFQRTLVMPNTVPPIVHLEDVKRYRSELEAVGTELQFLMTFKINEHMNLDMIAELKKAGTIAGKLYPKGVTTHSEEGIEDVQKLYPVFSAMEEEELVLSIHGEMPEANELEAEAGFLPILKKIANNFPRLRIVLEHISTQTAVECISSLPSTVAATITVHHLFLTIDDVQTSKGLNPHLFCKPLPKTQADRSALIQAVTNGNPKFFLGTDSAPHLKKDKEGPHPKPGIYTTPVVLPLLAELFEEQGKLERLEAYTSSFGADFYRLPRNTQKIRLIKESWQVPEEYFGVIPFQSGESLLWRIHG